MLSSVGQETPTMEAAPFSERRQIPNKLQDVTWKKANPSKVKLFQCLLESNATKKYGRVEVSLHSILNSALDWDEW